MTRVGCIGGYSAVQWPHWSLKQLFADIGMEWVYETSYHRRRNVVAYYRTLDVQVCWRPTHQRDPRLLRHMNTLKLANAGSFGIPTVSFPEPAYVAEWSDACLFSETINGLVRLVHYLKDDPGLYREWSQKAYTQAQAYHIERIADLYRALPGAT